MYFFSKRLIDLIGASLGIIIFSLLLVLTALLIKIDSNGSILVEVSHRVGKDGKKFRMYKFRSMIADAHVKIKKDLKFKSLYEKFKKNSFKLEEDPRITRIGRFIRKTSIDETPQFFNVLKGNMSLVGPRALYPEELEERKREHPNSRETFNKALSIKPGITGPWQVSGRSDLDFEERIKLDAEYSDRKSILYDLFVLLKTIPAVIRGKGAF